MSISCFLICASKNPKEQSTLNQSEDNTELSFHFIASSDFFHKTPLEGTSVTVQLSHQDLQR